MNRLYTILHRLQRARQECDRHITSAEEMKPYGSDKPAAPEYRQLSEMIEEAERQAERIVLLELSTRGPR